MEKYTALLIPAYLSGCITTVVLILILTPASDVSDGLIYFPIPLLGLPLLIIGGALVGIITIFLARGISYLFLDPPQ